MRKTLLLWTLLVTLFSFFAATAAAQDTNDTFTHQVQPGEYLLSLSLQHNVCIDQIKAANPDLIFGGRHDPLPSAEIKIPTDAPECYEQIFVMSGDSLLDVSEQYNICPEAMLWTIQGKSIIWSEHNTPLRHLGLDLFVPLNALPCFNDEGQRLYYQNVFKDGEWQFVEEYTDMQVYTVNSPQEQVKNIDEFAQKMDLCPADLIWINPAQVFIKNDARSCDFITLDNGNIQTLYEVSRELNICIEIIKNVQIFWLDTWTEYVDTTIAIPQDAPPCYDKNGNRLNHDDKAVHETQPGEFLVDIAEQYDVCVADLVAANPFIDANQIRPPKVLFIPDAPPCNRPYRHKLAEGENFTTVSQFFNVCVNRIADANPWIFNIADAKPGDSLLIPDRPPCYEMTYSGDYYTGHRIRDYVCYAQAIDFVTDYTGHEPMISPVALDVKDNFCYERGNWATTVIYENEPITAYRIRPYDTMSQVAACFKMDINDLVTLNSQDYSYEVRPYGYWVLPQNYDRDCALLTMNIVEYKQYINDLMNSAGSLNDEGVYVVNHQDTLSSIGKQFGYLPEWIAAENSLENPDMIFHLQELKLPSHPNYWQLATIGGGVLAIVSISSALSLVLRWRRRKPKRKNEAG